MTEQKKYILNEVTAMQKLQRMAFEITEQNIDEVDELILAGIRENGVVLAHIVAGYLKNVFNGSVKVIEVELNKRSPAGIHISEELDYTDKVIILVDDVTNSGRTLLYALKPFLAFHPRKIQTLTLVERTHKLYPVVSDYVGVSLATTLQEHIFVEVEGERVKGAYLV
ncbi:MAG: phosphoribosyltransferase family protein [Chitinophagaceae bacterium]